MSPFAATVFLVLDLAGFAFLGALWFWVVGWLVRDAWRGWRVRRPRRRDLTLTVLRVRARVGALPYGSEAWHTARVPGWPVS